MRKPRILDLCCCAGGAAQGYKEAGFVVVGVDNKPQPRYVGHAFYQADAVEFARQFGHRFDAVHWSPPCQSSTTTSNRWRGKGGKADSHENMIPVAFETLAALGKPFVLENVPGARRWMKDHGYTVIRGESFGLGVDRPRLFATSFPLPKPPKGKKRHNPVGVYGALDGRRLTQHPRKDGSHQYAAKTLAEGSEAMGIGWMEWEELTESIPPTYTRYVGGVLLDHLKQSGALAREINREEESA